MRVSNYARAGKMVMTGQNNQLLVTRKKYVNDFEDDYDVKKKVFDFNSVKRKKKKKEPAIQRRQVKFSSQMRR